MTDLKAQMLEDRALRDAARALVEADVAHLRANFAGKSLSERVVSRVSESAVEVFDEAVEVADSNRGVLATLVAAIFLWFARNPIMAFFEGEETGNETGNVDSDQSIHGIENTDG